MSLRFLAALLAPLVIGMHAPGALAHCADACDGNVCRAHICEGASAGQKIARAIAALPDNGGTVDARSVFGIIDEPLQVGGPTRAVRLTLGAGTYVVSRTITVGMRSSIEGLPTGAGVGGTDNSTALKALASPPLDAVIRLGDGTPAGRAFGAVLQDLIVDGGGAAGTGAAVDAGAVVVESHSERIDLTRLTVQNAGAHGIVFKAGTSVAKLSRVVAIGNRLSGLQAVGASAGEAYTNDLFISQSEFENNGQDGMTLNGASGVRITQCDFGGNRRFGLSIYNTPDSSAGFQIVSGNQFGNNYGNDLVISDTFGRNIITGNLFIGSSNRNQPAAAIQIWNGRGNVVTSNIVWMHGAGKARPLAAGIQFITPTGRNVVASNLIHRSTASDAAIYGPRQGAAALMMSGNLID